MKIDKDEFGKHLILDVVVFDEAKPLLVSREYCGQYIDMVIEMCGMQPVIPTIAMQFPFSNEHVGLVKKLVNEGVKSKTLQEHREYVKSKEKNDTGVSAFSIWNTSHCSAHSCPECNYISIDLYSCTNFDEKPVVQFTEQYFMAKENKITVIQRGVGMPQEVSQFERTLTKED